MEAHEHRVRATHAAFVREIGQLVHRVGALDDTAATRSPDGGGWSPAQIAWHVALTNEFLAGILNGDVAERIVPKPAVFREQLSTMQFPDRMRTFPLLEPPSMASRAEAIAKLLRSADVFVGALTGVTHDRCATECAQMRFGIISLYEVGEFTATHVRRHLEQLSRTVET